MYYLILNYLGMPFFYIDFVICKLLSSLHILHSSSQRKLGTEFGGSKENV